MALAESINGILGKNASGEAPSVSCDETDTGALVRLSYPNDASYSAHTSADVEALRKVGKFALSASEVSHPQSGGHVVTLKFSAASK